MGGTPDSVSKRRQTLGEKESLWLSKLNKINELMVGTQEEEQKKTADKLFCINQIEEIRIELRKLQRGTRRQRKAGFGNWVD